MHLRQLLYISPGTDMAVRCLVRDWFLVFTATMVAGFHHILNQVVVLPVGDLYRGLMFDSLQEAVTHDPLK